MESRNYRIVVPCCHRSVSKAGVGILPLSTATKMQIAPKFTIVKYFDSGLRYGHGNDFIALQARLFGQNRAPTG